MTIPIKIISKQEYLKNNQKPDQENVWDNISIPWAKYVVKKVPAVEEFLKDKKGKVIDIGCGSGRNMIPNKDIEYYAVDFSSCQLGNSMMYAKDSNVKAKFFKLKANKLSKKDFKENMFDAGLFIATLHCMDSKQEREEALKELYRILKKGSEALITVWDSNDARFNGLKGDIYMNWREEGKEYFRYYYLYDKQELIDLLRGAGFEILEIYGESLHDRFSKKNWIIRIRK